MKNDKLIKLNSVLEQYQVSKSKWYSLIASGDAPKPIKIQRSSFWSQLEISQYIELLKEQSLEQRGN